MTTRTSPLTDLDRLRSVARYDFADPRLRETLDGIVERTAHRLDDAVTAVNIVLDRAAVTVAGHGAEGSIAAAVGGLPVEWTFCSRVVSTGRAQVVDDAAGDPGTDVDGRPFAGTGLHSYAGVPLRTDDGRVLGAHCALHPEPGHFGPEALEVLEEAADAIMLELERYRRDTVPG